MRHFAGLSMGYAVLYSSGNRTNTHYNLQLGGETAIMVKDRFVSAYAEPEYTIGVGGSGGAIQQYVYGQNHPGLFDGGVPQYSYPDMVTQTIHVGDCELIERWFDSKVLANPLSMWRTWVNRSLLEGLNASATRPNPYAAVDAVHADARLDRVHQRLARPLAARAQPALVRHRHGAGPPGYDPAVHGPVEWTHWGDLVNIYGTDEHGFARTPWANGGVQYGLDGAHERRDHARAVPRRERERRLVEGRRTTWCRRAARSSRRRCANPANVRRVERPQHEPLARRRRDAGRTA